MYRGLSSRGQYIETIYILLNKKDKVYSIDIVNYMKVSRPSVSVAISKLIKDGYVNKDDRSITLTPKGQELGKELHEKYVFFYDFFVEIGVDSKTAYKEACFVEHIISSDTFFKIKKFVLEHKL